MRSASDRRPAKLTEQVLSAQAPATGLAPSLDWTSFVTAVRNQGSCGSCWAFAVTAAMESNVLIRENRPATPDDRAEQILVSCSGAGSCSGGYISSASDYIKSTGLPAESYFPYTATNNSCTNAQSGWQNYTGKIGTWSYVNTAPANLSASKNFSASGGSLTVTVTTPSGCSWAAQTNAPSWITLGASASGTGTGSFTYSVPKNTGARRSGTVGVGGLTHTATQSQGKK